MKSYLESRICFHGMFLVLLIVLLYPVQGYSLDNERWSSGLSFHFYPPGARALGMGGAFVGLADDATAAASNPAGLAQLTRMQIAVEGRYISQDSDKKAFHWSGGGYGGPYTTSSRMDDVTNLSFGGFTTPIFNNSFNLAVFYDRPLNMSSSKYSRQTFANSSRYAEYPNSSDFSMDEFGVSVARGWFDGKFMLGFGLSAQRFDIGGNVNWYDGRRLYESASIDDSGIQPAVRMGMLVKPINDLRIGLSYTYMPSFGYSETYHNVLTGVDTKFETDFNMPDNISGGLAYNIFPNWVALLELRYILYSQLKDCFITSVRYPFENATASNYSVDDILEIHFGTEYILNAIPNVPIALRGGIYYEPAHDLKYNGAGNIQRHLFDGGDSQMHYTFGTGVVLMNHYQVDVGADLTSESQNVAVSMVYQF